jgi:hypothetical protein
LHKELLINESVLVLDRLDPVNEVGHSGVDAWTVLLTTSITPGHNSSQDKASVHLASQGSSRISTTSVYPAVEVASAQHTVQNVLASSTVQFRPTSVEIWTTTNVERDNRDGSSPKND